MATTTVEESPSKLPSSTKKKMKEKSISSLKGSISNSLFGSNSTSRMDASELPTFKNDHLNENRLGNFVTGLKSNHSTTPDVNNSSPVKSSKRKSSSESSNSGSCSNNSTSGKGLGMTNSTHPEEPVSRRGGGGGGGSQPTNRSFSSGSSDGEEEREKEEDIQHRHSRKTKTTKLTKPSPTIGSLESDDDEATDSADEGNSGEEERGRKGRRAEILSSGVLGLRQSDRLISRKDSSESTNSATSPVINSTSNKLIFVESALPKEPMVGPVNMAVGYGAGADSMAPSSSVFDKTPPQSPLSTPIMHSPKPLSDRPHSPGTPILISPPCTASKGPPASSMTAASSSVVPPPLSHGVSLNPVAPSPSLQGPSFNLPFENWVYQAQAAAVYSPFPLTSSHPGSVATTPVAVDSGSYLSTGAPVFLRGTVCQESDGVLIVSVQWRNKTFSGSLIDMNQHEWAPPRLAGGFDEPLTHLKDLCKQKEKRESENQQVTVDVEGDDSNKDTTSGSEKMECSTKEEDSNESSVSGLESSTVDSKTEKAETKPEVRSHGVEKDLQEEQQTQMDTGVVHTSRPKLPRNQSIESEPGDMEIVEDSSSNPQSQNHSPSTVTTTTTTSPRQKPKLGAAKVSVDSVYSDISDVSDSEEKSRREVSNQPPSQSSGSNGVSKITPFMASDPPSSHPQSRNSRMKKIPAEEIQHTLPSFSAINASSSTQNTSQELADKNYDGRMKPKGSSDKDSPSDSPASLLRSNLLSSYPSVSTTGTTMVSTPNQNHRHSFASNASATQTTPTGGILVSSSMMHSQSNDHLKTHTDLPSMKTTTNSLNVSNFSIESLNARSSSDSKDSKLSHSRSSSPHPLSLKPREIRGRSTSPVRKSNKRDGATLPPFNAAGIVHHQDMMKPTPLDCIPTAPNHPFPKSQVPGDESDSSGSGSILSTHRKKRPGKQHRNKTAEPLIGLKDSKEETSIKVPETPTLGPIGIHNFNLKIQPISPGIDYPAQQQHMPSSIHKEVPTVPVCVANVSSPARSPAARVASPHTTTVGEVMGALLTTGSSGNFMENSLTTSISKPHPEKGEKETHHKDVPSSERRHAGSSSSPSSVSSTSIPGISLGMPAPGYPLPRPSSQGVIQAPPQGRGGEAVKHDQYKRRSPVPSEMLRQDREQSRKRKNASPSTTESTKHQTTAADHEKGGNPEAILRGQHLQHSFPIAQQQGFSPYNIAENEKMDLLPSDFNYDPNLPMTIQYQFLSYVNQKKQAQMKEYEDQLKEINRKDKEEMERHNQHLAQFPRQQQQQQHPRAPKRPRIGGDHHMTPPVAPLQMPHHSPPATKDQGNNSGKQKKSSHHSHRMNTGSHTDHGGDDHHYNIHNQTIKTEPFDMTVRHNSHKPQSGGSNIGKQSQPHSAHRPQPLPTTSSKQSSQKPNQPQPRAIKTEQPFIKTEGVSSEQQHQVHVPHNWPAVIPVGVVPPGTYQYSMLQQQQQQQQQQAVAAHSLQAKDAKQQKDHKEHKEMAAGPQHTAFHTQPISAPIVAFSTVSQSWAAAAAAAGSPFIPAQNIIQPVGSASRQEHSSSPAITTTTSVITGKTASEMHPSSSHHRTHRNMGQSSPSSTNKKTSSAFTVGDSGGDRRSGVHKMHEHGRPSSSNSVSNSRRLEGSSGNQRTGSYTSQNDGANESSNRRSVNHPHSHAHSTPSSSSSSNAQQSNGHSSSSSSRSHKSTAEHLAATQFQAAAVAAHQMNLLQQQQAQAQAQSISSPLPGIQFRQGIPIANAGLMQNWEEWARLQEMIQKGQIGAIGSAGDPWQQMQQMQMLAQAQGVPMVPLADPNVLLALHQQQQQQQQQHQNAEQATNALQNIQILQAAAAGGNMIQFMHPAAMAGAHPAMAAGLYDQAAFGPATTMLPPFPMAATSQKDS